VRAAVLAAFPDGMRPLEGEVRTVYLDIKSYATTAIGLLCNSAPAVAALPLKHPDGRPATNTEKVAEFHRIKAGGCGAKATPTDPDAYRRCLWPGQAHPETGIGCFAHKGWTVSQRHAAKLWLTKEDVDQLTRDKMRTMWRVIVSRWPDADVWPADAQYAVLSWAWGVGPSARWPLFDAALRAGDFAVAALHVSMRGAGTIPKRNAENMTALRNAAVVSRTALDPDVLYYPRALSDETPTLPALPDVGDAVDDGEHSIPPVLDPDLARHDEGDPTAAARRQATAWSHDEMKKRRG
jgi:hypothetical protein